MLAELIVTASLTIAYRLDSDDRSQSIVLYAEQGRCPEGSKEAGWLFNDKSKPDIPGCWRMHPASTEPMVQVAYVDGDRFLIPVRAFTGLSRGGQT